MMKVILPFFFLCIIFKPINSKHGGSDSSLASSSSSNIHVSLGGDDRYSETPVYIDAAADVASHIYHAVREPYVDSAEHLLNEGRKYYAAPHVYSDDSNSVSSSSSNVNISTNNNYYGGYNNGYSGESVNVNSAAEATSEVYQGGSIHIPSQYPSSTSSSSVDYSSSRGGFSQDAVHVDASSASSAYEGSQETLVRVPWSSYQPSDATSSSSSNVDVSLNRDLNYQESVNIGGAANTAQYHSYYPGNANEWSTYRPDLYKPTSSSSRSNSNVSLNQGYSQDQYHINAVSDSTSAVHGGAHQLAQPQYAYSQPAYSEPGSSSAASNVNVYISSSPESDVYHVVGDKYEQDSIYINASSDARSDAYHGVQDSLIGIPSSSVYPGSSGSSSSATSSVVVNSGGSIIADDIISHRPSQYQVIEFSTVCCSTCSDYPGLDRFKCFAQCEAAGNCLDAHDCVFFGDAAASGVHTSACRRASETCGIALYSASFYVDEETCFDIAAGQCIATVQNDYDVSICAGYDFAAHDCWRQAYGRKVRESCGRGN
eukprot:GHVL01031380.1.p1 GENE.GHVL01031380.1~~GHVL01031380.1.p1  ORF type:complete len:542 (+),score=72.83 GHVL01031380.1:175-1800(+)